LVRHDAPCAGATEGGGAKLTGADVAAVCNTVVVPAFGQQRRLEDSSAFYNAPEATLLADLLGSLLTEHAALAAAHMITNPVKEDQVGVICLSRAQVVHVRNVLRERHLAGVNVGTVDDFQGQEQRVIFISTVLTAAARNPLGIPAPYCTLMCVAPFL
jgi:AAA domain